MFRRFSLYIDIVASPEKYAPILGIIEAFTDVCEPITNISTTFEKPNFIYNLLIITFDKIDFEQNMLEMILESYTNIIVLDVPNKAEYYDLLHDQGIHHLLRKDYFFSELEATIKSYIKLELLTNENTLLDNLFNSAQNSIVITDKKGNIQYANPYFAMLTEYKKEELIDNSPRVIKTDYYPASFYTDLWDTITQGKVWEGVFINKSKSAHLFYEEATITPIFNAHGSIEKYLKIGRNITREKMLLAELSKEIKVAKKVLSTFLPAKHEDTHLVFDYHLTDFNEIGGDFIYFKQSTPTKYYYAIIDVMGHGVSSALVAITVAQMFDDHVGYLKLEETVREINKMLCHINQEDNDYAQYVTGIFIEFDFETNKLKYINAGHPNLILQHKDFSTNYLASNNLILGIIDNEVFRVETIPLESVQKLITFTDGLYENCDKTLDQALTLLCDSLLSIHSSEEIHALFALSGTIKDDTTTCIIELM